MKAPTWPDGTPKSLGNSFTRHLNGHHSIFWTDGRFRPNGGRFVEAKVLENKHAGFYSKAPSGHLTSAVESTVQGVAL